MRDLIEYLIKERGMQISIPKEESEQFRLYRSLVNTRPSGNVSDEYIKAENEFLQSEIDRKGITDIDDLRPIENNIYGKVI